MTITDLKIQNEKLKADNLILQQKIRTFEQQGNESRFNQDRKTREEMDAMRTEINNLKSQMTVKSSEYESKIAALKGELSTKVASVVAEYESKLAHTRGDHDSKFALKISE